MSEKKTPRSRGRGPERPEDMPEWIMPSIRALVKTFNYPNAAPHVFTGVESILPLLARMSAAAPDTPSKRSRSRSDIPQISVTDLSSDRILGLIAVIFLYVLTRMKDEDVSPEQYNEWRETALDTLLKTPTGQGTTYEELLPETEQLMPMAQQEGWLQMEWFTNITPLNAMDEMEGVEMTEEAARLKDEKKKGLKSGGSDYIGLGTMMQDATDYLGQHQREDYKSWKAKIMAHVQELEAA